MVLLPVVVIFQAGQVMGYDAREWESPGGEEGNFDSCP